VHAGFLDAAVSVCARNIIETASADSVAMRNSVMTRAMPCSLRFMFWPMTVPL
jgi:hypothetical protein